MVPGTLTVLGNVGGWHMYKKLLFFVLIQVTSILFGMEDLPVKEVHEDWLLKVLSATFGVAQHYAQVGLTNQATSSQIDSAYKKMILTAHPDKGGDAEKFKKLAEHFKVLRDSAKKAEYDRIILGLRLYAFGARYATCGLLLYAAGVGTFLLKSHFDASSKKTALLIEKIYKKKVAALLELSFDRYNPGTLPTGIRDMVSVQPLMQSLSPKTASELEQSLILFDACIAHEYQKIAWQHYACTSFEELMHTCPGAVERIKNAEQQLENALFATKKELGMSYSRSITTLLAVPVFAVAGGILAGFVLLYNRTKKAEKISLLG